MNSFRFFSFFISLSLLNCWVINLVLGCFFLICVCLPALWFDTSMFRHTMWIALIIPRNEYGIQRTEAHRIYSEEYRFTTAVRFDDCVTDNWMHSLSWHIDWFICHIFIPCKQPLESHQKFIQHTNAAAPKNICISNEAILFFVFTIQSIAFQRKILDVQLFKVNAILHWLAQFCFLFDLTKTKNVLMPFFHSNSSAFTVRCPNIYIRAPDLYMCVCDELHSLF